MSRKILNEPIDFIKKEPYKSLIHILDQAPNFSIRLQKGLATHELRHLLVSGYSAKMGAYKNSIITNFRKHIQEKLPNIILLDQKIATSGQAFNNIIKRAQDYGIIEKKKKNKWTLSKKYISIIEKTDILNNIKETEQESQISSSKDEKEYSYTLYFLSKYIKNNINDAYTKDKFSNATEKILEGRKEILEIILKESRVINWHFREKILNSIVPILDRNLADCLTSYEDLRPGDQYWDKSILAKEYRCILPDHGFRTYGLEYTYNLKDQTFTINNINKQFAEIIKKHWYPSKKISDIISMLSGYQLNKKASAFILGWFYYWQRILVINDEITIVIPPSYHRVNLPVDIPSNPSYDRLINQIKSENKSNVFDQLDDVTSMKELNHIFEEYIDMITKNIISDEMKIRLNEIRSIFYKNGFD
jgi:hypothetical protein